MTVAAPPPSTRSTEPCDREELEALVEALIEEARQRARRRRRRRGAYLAFALCVGLVTYLGLSHVHGGTAEATSGTGAQRGAAAGGAQGRIASTTWSNSRGAIFTINADGTDLRRVTHDRGPAWPSWSPDGKSLAFEMDAKARQIPGVPGSLYDPRSVYVMRATGSGRRLLARGGERPAWSPVAPLIAFAINQPSKPGGIYIVGASGRSPRRLANRGGSPAWSPDGTKIAYSCGKGTVGAICVINMDGTGRHVLAHLGGAAAWSPDGTTIAFQNGFPTGHVFVIRANGTGLRRLSPQIDYKNQDCNVAWSPDGKHLAFSPKMRGGIYLMSVRGTDVTPLKGSPPDACGISWGRASSR